MSEARALYAPEWLTYPEHPETLSRTIWTDSFTRNNQGELCIDGVTVSDLVAEHETRSTSSPRRPSAPAPAPTAPLLSRLSPRTVRR